MDSIHETDYVSTQKACEILGVSKTIVKRLADNGQLETWKTPGGHRRIRLDSIKKALEEKHGVVEHLSTKQTKPSNAQQEAVSVMVIDDDPVIQELFTSFEKNFGIPMQLTQALNGYEGLIKAGEQDLSLIFVDLNMPYMNGYEAINALRQFKNLNQVTIVVITGEAIQKVHRNQLPADVVLLEKPLNPDVIKKFIDYEFQLKNQLNCR